MFNVWKKKHFLVAVICLPLPINILGSFIFFIFIYFMAVLNGLWDLRSLTRDQTQALETLEALSPNDRITRNSHYSVLFYTHITLLWFFFFQVVERLQL